MGRRRRIHIKYVPRERGICPVCHKPVYKGSTRYKGRYFHSACLVRYVREETLREMRGEVE